ncbi:MAG: hypothetical protein PHP85_13065 [Gallionella sp.]|nr:hypothetical protein [Gallionella sp.]
MSQKISKDLKSSSRVACTEQTYQFNYQKLVQLDTPHVTCLVPSDWLSKNLPTMGGAVIYLDERRNEDAITDYLFEFSEYPQEQSLRIIHMKIYTKKLLGSNSDAGYTGLPDLSIKIHCQIADDAGSDWHSEVILLNHLFCLYALSAFKNYFYIGIYELVTFLTGYAELSFKFGIGDSPAQILSGMTDETMLRDSILAFVVIFSNENMRITYLEELAVLKGEETFLIITDALVNQDRMAISLLTGFEAGPVC